MIIFSVDPGFSGAWAVIVDGKATIVGDMPVAGDGPRKRVSANVLAGYMRDARPELCVVEMVSAMPKQGVSSTFRFGMGYGAVLATAAIVGVPLELVTPQVWKKFHRLTGLDKEASRQKALDLAPGLTDSLARRRDDGRAEAILIGLYGAATYDHRPETARAA